MANRLVKSASRALPVRACMLRITRRRDRPLRTQYVIAFALLSILTTTLSTALTTPSGQRMHARPGTLACRHSPP
jgi:hypothetical protein